MTRNDFLTRLNMLALVSGMTLSKDVLGMYDKHLAHLGYQNLCRATEDILASRKGTDRFPSIADIRQRIQPDEDPGVEAIEAANRIPEAIRLYGYTAPERAQEFIGELGWMVVERGGGWISLCESLQTDQLPTMRAQWRELARALWHRAKEGRHNVPPRLPTPHRGASKQIEGPEGIGTILPRVVSDETKPQPGGHSAKTPISSPSKPPAKERSQVEHRESAQNPRPLLRGLP